MASGKPIPVHPRKQPTPTAKTSTISGRPRKPSGPVTTTHYGAHFPLWANEISHWAHWGPLILRSNITNGSEPAESRLQPRLAAPQGLGGLRCQSAAAYGIIGCAEGEQQNGNPLRCVERTAP